MDKSEVEVDTAELKLDKLFRLGAVGQVVASLAGLGLARPDLARWHSAVR